MKNNTTGILAIDKQLFNEIIEALKQQSEIDYKCKIASNSIFNFSNPKGYDNDILKFTITNILKLAMHDEMLYSAIDHFIDDCKFGNLWHDNEYIYNGKANFFKNASDLYNFLIEKNTDHGLV